MKALIQKSILTAMLALFGWSQNINGQSITWQKEYSGRVNGYDLFLDPNGDITVLCDTIVPVWGGTTRRPSIIKIDANGAMIGYNILTGMNTAASFTKAPDGSFYIAGSTEPSAGIQQFALAKTDNYGHLEWIKTYSPSSTTNSAYDMILASDGNLISVGDHGWYVSVKKINTNGDTLWTRQFGDPSNYIYMQGRSIRETPDGGFLICGRKETTVYTPVFKTERDIMLIKLDVNGNLLWEKTYGSIHEDMGNSAITDASGNIYILGEINLSYSWPLYRKLWLAKTNANGDTLWTKEIGGENDMNYAAWLGLASNGNVMVSGGWGMENAGGSGYSKGFLMSLDQDGDSLWSLNYGEDEMNTYVKSVWETGNNCFITTGTWGGQKMFLNEVCKNVSPPGVPLAPTNLTATPVNSIELKWQDNSNNEDGFYVENALSASGPWTQIASVGANVTTYIQTTGLANGVEYFYRVSAYNTNGTSSFSNVASAVEGATGINHLEHRKLNINIYPNPASAYFTINIQGKETTKRLSLKMINMHGQLTGQYPLDASTTTISVQDLPAGIYFYSLMDNFEILKTGKMVIK